VANRVTQWWRGLARGWKIALLVAIGMVVVIKVAAEGGRQMTANPDLSLCAAPVADDLSWFESLEDGKVLVLRDMAAMVPLPDSWYKATGFEGSWRAVSAWVVTDSGYIARPTLLTDGSFVWAADEETQRLRTGSTSGDSINAVDHAIAEAQPEAMLSRNCILETMYAYWRQVGSDPEGPIDYSCEQFLSWIGPLEQRFLQDYDEWTRALDQVNQDTPRKVASIVDDMASVLSRLAALPPAPTDKTSESYSAYLRGTAQVALAAHMSAEGLGNGDSSLVNLASTLLSQGRQKREESAIATACS
jgi:hypothetical protein